MKLIINNMIIKGTPEECYQFKLKLEKENDRCPNFNWYDSNFTEYEENKIKFGVVDS